MINNFKLNVENVVCLKPTIRHQVFSIFSKVQLSDINTDDWKQNFDFLDKQGLIKILEKKTTK